MAYALVLLEWLLRFWEAMWRSWHTLCRFSSFPHHWKGGAVDRKHSRGRWFTVWKLSSLLHICIMVCLRSSAVTGKTYETVWLWWRCWLLSQKTKQQWRLRRKLYVFFWKDIHRIRRRNSKPGANRLGIDRSDSNRTGRERYVASSQR